MAQWVPFYFEPYEAEVAVGLYDFWLSRVERGLSQVDRCMKHEISPMLENAFERRFCYGQLGTDISDFEAQHCTRVEQCINYLDDFFSRHQTDVPESDLLNDATDLVGLVHDEMHTETGSSKVTSINAPYHVSSLKTDLLLLDTLYSSPPLLVADDVDSDSFAEQVDMCGLVLRQYSERHRLSAMLAANVPRTRRGVRMRREPLSAKGAAKNSKTKGSSISTHEHMTRNPGRI